MHARILAGLSLPIITSGIFFFSVAQHAHAQNVTLYSQSDASGEMVSQQPTFQNTWISSASLGNLVLGKDHLTITFTMKDPNANNTYGQPAGVALGTCATCKNLQTYYFTAADRTLLSDGAFHTFTVQTGTTTLGTADGETPIHVTFFGLSQYHNSTHLKSNAAGTIPFLLIEAASLPIIPPVPQAPEGSVMVYEQSDRSGVMTNPQATFQNAHIDSASLGNLNLGKDKLYITFTIKDPRAGNVYRQPGGICIQPLGSTGCGSALQKYNFTDADRVLLADQAFHTFMVETGTTTSTYADGTRPVSVGFFGLSQYQYGTKVKSNTDATIPFLKIQKPPPPDPCATPGVCASNVLFLPGIEASRLYRPEGSGGEKKLWEPGLNDLLQDLYLTPEGKSLRNDVYAKEDDVVDEVPVTGANIYKSFIAKMNELRDVKKLINDWEAVPYDWRLSLDDILAGGKQTGARISYLDATSTPYVVQELKRLAASSKTHKVTVVAHSNGGLVAKRLTQILGAEAAHLIDKIIFVAVPQAGTPAAVAAALHGYGQNFGFGPVVSVSQATARTFASTSPMTYHLLPSTDYFTQIDNPVVSFAPSLPDWVSRYGATIHSAETLRTFLTDSYGRVDAQTGDISQPIQGSAPLLASAEAVHAGLDNWTPPAGVELIQIAGWGVPTTVTGITYKKKEKGTGITPEPNLTIDGDGTVVVPSALWVNSASTTRYWVDLKRYSNDHWLDTLGGVGGFSPFNHSRTLEPKQLLDFLSDQITNSTKALSDYTYLSTEPPPAPTLRLRYALHSPLTLNLYDSEGRHTGVSTTTGQIETQIPGTYYTEFGEVKYLFSDATDGRIIMEGYDAGTFTFNVEEYSGDTLTASTTFKDIPTTASTNVTLNIESDLTTLSPMQIDKDGDGAVDATLAPRMNDTVTLDITPPELQASFDPILKSLSFIGTDDSGAATVTTSTVYPEPKKKQKEHHGVATTTVTARDEAGNTTVLIYTEHLPSPKERDAITLWSLTYNGSTSSPQVGSSLATISYKWRNKKDGAYQVFASHLRTASNALESHYRPKKNTTAIVLKPRELDDSDNDDDSDARPTKLKLPGMVIPYISTEKGSLITGY